MRFRVFAAAALALVTGVAASKAGANVVACVNIDWEPSERLTVIFKPGVGSPGRSPDDKNIYPNGHEASATVRGRGLTCADVGYVKETTIREKAVWSLGYTVGEYSGSMSSVWFGWLWNRDCWLEGYSPKTYVCPERELCNQTKVTWDESLTYTLYFIFTPGTTEDISDTIDDGL